MAQTPTSVEGLETVEARNHKISRTPPARHRCAGRRENGGELPSTGASFEHPRAENPSFERFLFLPPASPAHRSWLVQPPQPPASDPPVRACGTWEGAT